jgi:hypothetical protein
MTERTSRMGGTNLNVKNVSGSLAEEIFVWASQCEWLEHISRATITLEHRMVDHIAHI